MSAVTKIINGNVIAKQIQAQLASQVKDKLVKGNVRPPRLQILLAGDNAASESYVKKKMEVAHNLNIECAIQRLAATDNNRIYSLIDQLNRDSKVDGILVQLPLPLKFDKAHILETISPDKDVDCLHPYNQLQVHKFGEKAPLLPCTPHGILKVCDHIGLSLDSKRVVVIGKSNLVGLPVSILMMMRNATVTVCGTHSKDHLDKIVEQSDVVVAAAGCLHLVKKVKTGAVILDVGISKNPETNKLGGDVHPQTYSDAEAYTPVPGGIGPLTVTMLMHNVITLWGKHTA